MGLAHGISLAQGLVPASSEKKKEKTGNKFSFQSSFE
jgi:hypothetical protein